MLIIREFLIKPPMYICPLPVGGKIIHIATKVDEIVLFVQCDHLAPYEQVTFWSIDTGAPIPPEGEYLGTTLHLSDTVVKHTYRIPQVTP